MKWEEWDSFTTSVTWYKVPEHWASWVMRLAPSMLNRWKKLGIHQNQNTNNGPPDQGVHNHKLWNLLWKIKLSYKVLLFTWKILNKAIPVKDELNRRRIPCETTCCLCNYEEESIDHLFLQCNFARAVWFGIDINRRNLMIQHITVQQWIQDLFLNSAP